MEFQNSRYEYTTREFATVSISGDPAIEAEMERQGWQRAWADITMEGTFAVYRRVRRVST